jgi:threonine synthase
MESLEPTGSFKDRGSVAMITKLRQHCKPGSRLVEDSSGNAGSSIAAYSAAAGFRCVIYTLKQVRKIKAAQIQAYGAELVKIEGGRDKLVEATIKAAKHAVYASHIWSPFFRDGIRTLSYEVCEQRGWRSPDFVVTPASAGTLLLGVIAGFRDLKNSGVIESEPTYVVAQPEKIAPIHCRLHNLPYEPRLPKRIVTDALIGTRPALMKVILKELTAGRWLSGTVTDKAALQAQEDLARRGFYVEPSSAIAWKLYQDMKESGRIPDGTSTVIIASGNGLKTTAL